MAARGALWTLVEVATGGSCGVLGVFVFWKEVLETCQPCSHVGGLWDAALFTSDLHWAAVLREPLN